MRAESILRVGGTARAGLRQATAALGDLASLVLAAECAGCGAAGAPLCAGCRALLAASPVRPVRLTAWPGAPPVRAGAVYAGPARRAVIAWKDEGRHDVTPELAALLARALLSLPASGALGRPGRPGHASMAWSPSVMLVPVPSRRAARRERGDDVVLRLARQAAAVARTAGLDARAVPALHLVRAVADQSGLGRAGRRANVAHAMRARRGAAGRLAGRLCVIVDDVLTTGITVREVSRALAEINVVPAAVIACCATPLLSGLSAGASLD